MKILIVFLIPIPSFALEDKAISVTDVESSKKQNFNRRRKNERCRS